MDLFRDTTLGQIIRVVSGKRLFQYEEEKHPELWQRYVDKEKSANMAAHGQTQPPETDDEKQEEGNQTRRDPSPSGSQSSGSTVVSNSQKDLRLGQPIDQEKGKDALIVTWWGPDDPEVSGKRDGLD